MCVNSCREGIAKDAKKNIPHLVGRQAQPDRPSPITGMPWLTGIFVVQLLAAPTPPNLCAIRHKRGQQQMAHGVPPGPATSPTMQTRTILSSRNPAHRECLESLRKNCGFIARYQRLTTRAVQRHSPPPIPRTATASGPPHLRDRQNFTTPNFSVLVRSIGPAISLPWLSKATLATIHSELARRKAQNSFFPLRVVLQCQSQRRRRNHQ